MPRPRWWRCGPDGRVVAMVGGRSYRQIPVQSRHPGPPPARNGFQAVRLSRRAARRLDTRKPDEDRPITVDGWTPVNNDGVYRGPITHAGGVRAIEQRCHGSALGVRGQGKCDPRRARSRHHHSASGQAQPGARDRGGEPAGADVGLCGGRRRALSRSPHAAFPRSRAGRLSAFFDGAGARAGATGRRCSTCSMPPQTRAPGRRAALSTPTFGKTGTTQDNRDALFIGFAGNLVVGVWVGRDDNGSLGKISGGTVPAQIWRNFMTAALTMDRQRGPPAAPIRRSATPSRSGACAGAAEPASAGMERSDEADA